MSEVQEVDGSSEKCNVYRGFLTKSVPRLKEDMNSVGKVLSRWKLPSR